MAKLSVLISSLYILVLTSYSMDKTLKDDNTKCMLACAFKKTGMAMSEDQRNLIKQHFHEIGMRCMKDSPISAADITQLKANQVATGPNVPCFLACVLKDTGIMDSNGMLSKESALELAKKVFNDAEELKAIENYLHSCSHLNNESVTDGDKGCERAMLSHKCMMENAAQFGFDL